MRRLDYGFTGYQVPVVPRASRSSRGRGRIRKKCEDNQIQGFGILSSVAGNLLQGSESSVPTNAACVQDLHHIVYANSNREREAEGISLKEDSCLQGNCDEKFFAFLPGLQGHHKSYKLNEFCHGQNNLILEVGSASGVYDQSEMIFFAKKLAAVNSRNNCGSSSNSVIGDSPCFGEFFKDKVGGVLEGKLGDKSYTSISEKDGIIPITGSSEDLIQLDREPHALVGSESDVKPSLLDCINHVPCPKHYDNVKVISRDDDENSVLCTQHITISKSYTPTADGQMKPMYCNGTNRHMDERSQNIYPFKKRKFFSQNPACSSDGGDNHSTAIGASSSVAGQVPPESKGCNVKLSIKSFKVPELFIEIPATATVGSLKRTVMEAVTTILGDGLHVGIMLQGKKVKDDNKTLLQTGISQDRKRHSLGFILEPRHAQITPPACTEDQSWLSGCTPQDLSKHSAPLTLQPGISYVSPNTLLLNLGRFPESNMSIVPSLADSSTATDMPETQAMAAVPSISMEALAMVPFCRKSNPEFVQRRIRRPFSASEVEALVQAVEKLGTGRWRDVKLCVFDSEKHRTYVDLKDKWKTLVHTARISPQQRRGEPVPQELLDRVLAAHAYWCEHRARPRKLGERCIPSH
ncbi:telomere repeat-binding protein 5-like [Juglans microcarpa x Juglans regia]|uniref:telomere repeat-binding protein 5-like n=1 Tax=Juglans microcarpa x Juglans regia TaxID=2249226 RepID=UPI001B7E0B71|nr:telomere repeat-binding protein 5-like [Juglans microcarpa x Juglans regia]